ncbi:MAG: hypothetical protein QXW83_00145 [Nitrososphaerales archaeon]
MKLLKEFFILTRLPFSFISISIAISGASMAPTLYIDRLVIGILAIFFGLSVGAHALDNIKGNPLHLSFTQRQLWLIAITGISIGWVLGLYLAIISSLWFVIFMILISFFAVTYNLELLKQHNPISLSIAFGFLPCLGGYFIMSSTISIPVMLMALAFAFICIGGIKVYEAGKPIFKDHIPKEKAGPLAVFANELIGPLVCLPVYLIALSLLLSKILS